MQQYRRVSVPEQIVIFFGFLALDVRMFIHFDLLTLIAFIGLYVWLFVRDPLGFFFFRGGFVGFPRWFQITFFLLLLPVLPIIYVAVSAYDAHKEDEDSRSREIQMHLDAVDSEILRSTRAKRVPYTIDSSEEFWHRF